MDGWVGGWMDGWESRVKDCLQQSKIMTYINQDTFTKMPLNEITISRWMDWWMGKLTKSHLMTLLTQMKTVNIPCPLKEHVSVVCKVKNFPMYI
jgi:hypothetical protein